MLLKTPDTNMSMSLVSIASPLAIDPNIYTLASGNSKIIIRCLLLTLICFADLVFNLFECSHSLLFGISQPFFDLIYNLK